MRRPLTAAVLLLVLGGLWGGAGGAWAQLPATPQLPSLGKGLFGKRPVERPAEGKTALPDTPSVFSRPPNDLAGREATLQALQDCYAREASKVKAAGAADTRVRRLRQLCENEELADTRAWLKWSKIGQGRSTQHILNALQQDAAEKALSAGDPPISEKP